MVASATLVPVPMFVDVTTRSKEMKRTTLPTIIRPIAAPVTVFHHHRYSGFVECLGEKAEIAELATTIKLDAVKSEIDRRLNITCPKLSVIGQVAHGGM